MCVSLLSSNEHTLAIPKLDVSPRAWDGEERTGKERRGKEERGRGMNSCQKHIMGLTLYASVVRVTVVMQLMMAGIIFLVCVCVCT